MLGRKMRWRRNGRTFEHLRPNPAYVVNLLLPSAYADNPSTSLPTKHIHASLNKIKHPVNVVKWTPEGRRLLTGSSTGEFTLWNRMGFNFETIMRMIILFALINIHTAMIGYFLVIIKY